MDRRTQKDLERVAQAIKDSAERLASIGEKLAEQNLEKVAERASTTLRQAAEKMADIAERTASKLAKMDRSVGKPTPPGGSGKGTSRRKK